MERDLPEGTVTFLFTDIEGSTALLKERGADDYAKDLEDHRRIVRAAIDRHGGVEVDTQGDAFFVAFSSAPEAAWCALEIHRELTGPVRIRAALHSGTAQVVNGGYVGVDVHRAARLCSTAHGGQTIISRATHGLLDGIDDIHPLGLHRLKDLTEPQEIYQLGAGDFPPPKTLQTTTLPQQLTPFLGRESELASLVEVLQNPGVRLVTLTGPGGTGKTRLSVQAAAEAADHFPDGVWWVPLDDLKDADLLLPTMATHLGATGDLAQSLQGRRTLIVLDNFEQLVQAAGQLGSLLRDAAGVTLLVTSREALRISGEHEVPLAPMEQRDSIELFMMHARMLDPSFESAPEVAEICRRLDHLPLAVELAAARTRVLPLDQLLDRLSDALTLLASRARDVPERQRTLRGAIEWSYDLLDEREREVLASFSVFAGGTTLDIAEVVTGATIEDLESLVDKSLIRAQDGRFSMLETIREFAREKLGASGDAADISSRHAAAYLERFTAANLAAESTGKQDFELAIPELGNARTALEYALESGQWELGLEIAVSLEQLWTTHDPIEGASWVRRLLDIAPSTPSVLLSRGWRVLGSVLNIHGLLDEAQDAYERSLVMANEVDYFLGMAELFHRLANIAVWTDDLPRAEVLNEECLSFQAGIDSHPKGEVQALTTRADIAWHRGDASGSVELTLRSIDMSKAIGFTWWEGIISVELAERLKVMGRDYEAAAAARRGLEVGGRIGDRLTVVFALGVLAVMSAERQDAHSAGILWGAIEAEESRGIIGQWGPQRNDYRAKLAGVEGTVFDEGVSLGRTLEPLAAAAHVLGG